MFADRTSNFRPSCSSSWRRRGEEEARISWAGGTRSLACVCDLSDRVFVLTNVGTLLQRLQIRFAQLCLLCLQSVGGQLLLLRRELGIAGVLPFGHLKQRETFASGVHPAQKLWGLGGSDVVRDFRSRSQLRNVVASEAKQTGLNAGGLAFRLEARLRRLAVLVLFRGVELGERF